MGLVVRAWAVVIVRLPSKPQCRAHSTLHIAHCFVLHSIVTEAAIAQLVARLDTRRTWSDGFLNRFCFMGMAKPTTGIIQSVAVSEAIHSCLWKLFSCSSARSVVASYVSPQARNLTSTIVVMCRLCFWVAHRLPHVMRDRKESATIVDFSRGCHALLSTAMGNTSKHFFFSFALVDDVSSVFKSPP